jgi:hypothetical protein
MYYVSMYTQGFGNTFASIVKIEEKKKRSGKHATFDESLYIRTGREKSDDESLYIRTGREKSDVGIKS